MTSVTVTGSDRAVLLVGTSAPNITAAILSPTNPQIAEVVVTGPQGPAGVGGGMDGYALDELNDVQIASLAGGQFLQYDATTSLWKNSGVLGTQNGGTGASTLNGYLVGSGTDALQAVAGIPASDISTPIDCGTFA
jgi:hypothetical protein